ncbi:MAG: hypothetical protein ACRD9R_16420 [Pyrinomonadaceae bacterium]
MSKRNSLKPDSEAESEDQIRARFMAVFERTNKNNSASADVAQLREMLSGHRELELWKCFTAPMGTVEETLYSLTPFIKPGIEACWRERLAQLRRDFGIKDSPPAESFLISHIAVCWLRLVIVEHYYTASASVEHNMKAGLYWDRRLTSAQRRYTRAVESLARLRALQAATRLIESRGDARRGDNNVRPLRALVGGSRDDSN